MPNGRNRPTAVADRIEPPAAKRSFKSHYALITDSYSRQETFAFETLVKRISSPSAGTVLYAVVQNTWIDTYSSDGIGERHILYVQVIGSPLRLTGLRMMPLILFLAGCGGPVRETEPLISGLIHQCFATVKESVFLSGRCQPIGGWPYCDTVKSLDEEPDPLWKGPQLPPTLRAFRENPGYWSGQIHAQQNYYFRKNEDQLIIYGGLPIGTPAPASSLSCRPDPAESRCPVALTCRWVSG